MESDKFCLRWNDFASNISSALGDLRNDTDCDLFDVTLACEDQTIRYWCLSFLRYLVQVHKIVHEKR